MARAFQRWRMEGYYEAPCWGIHPPVEASSLPDGGPLPSSPGAAGRLTAVISASAPRSPMYISVLTALGGRFGGRGAKGDSHSQSLNQQLHHLLIQGCWSTLEKWRWLADCWCNLRSPWHQTPYAQSSLEPFAPPMGRSVWQSCDWLLGHRGLPPGHVPNGDPWWKWH